MHFQIDLKRLFATVFFVLMLGPGAHAQQGPTETDPAEVWSWSDSGGYTSAGELIATVNGIQDALFAKCSQGGTPRSCGKLTWTGSHPNSSLFPYIYNGDYMLFWTDATRYLEWVGADGKVTSETTDASDIYTIERQIHCNDKAGYGSRTVSAGPNAYKITCVKNAPAPKQCDPTKACCKGAPPSLGDPVQVYNGIQTESETDYATADGLLSVKRQFRGQFIGWHMPGDVDVLDLYSKNIQKIQRFFLTERFQIPQINLSTGVRELRWVVLKFEYRPATPNGEFRVLNPDGSQTLYPATAAGTFPNEVSSDRVELLDAPTVEGALWRVTRASDMVEEYGTDGRLRKQQWRNGQFVVYQYTDGRLTKMQDNWSRQISFTHNADNTIAGATLPDGLSLAYSYQDGILTKVTYPDGTSRQYLYGEPANVAGPPLRYAMTGILDENGTRFTTFKFNDAYQAISTESAGGANKYTFEYGGVYTQATDPLGSKIAYYFTQTNGQITMSGQNQPGGAGCNATSNAYAFDPYGNVVSSRDFNGATTTYMYEPNRHLEIRRVEASGKPEARTVSTSWHASYHLPLQIAEPNRLTTFSYDAAGNLLSKSQQATTDTTGAAGFAAVLTGPVRNWTTTYNSAGQVLTVTGPRADVTTYAYDAQGNLATVTNAAGHLTTLSNYDANGKAGTITDVNGLTPLLSYSPRGWLLSKNVGGELTSYAYDGVGQLKKVTLPDTSTIDYTYDDAHRLTSIADSLGNRIAYTLDAMGNRITEQVKDPSGTLARQTTRVYDALNRLQQITGGQQ